MAAEPVLMQAAKTDDAEKMSLVQMLLAVTDFDTFKTLMIEVKASMAMDS